jgi:serine protease Do
MDSRFHAWRRSGLALGVAAAVALTLPTPARAQAPERDISVLRSGLIGGPQVGVSVRDISEADAQSAKLGAPAGAWVQNVRPDSPAAKAGIQTNDVIVTFDGERVRSAAHFARLVDETPAGRTVEAVVRRAGQPVTLSVTPVVAGRVRAFTVDPERTRRLADEMVARIRPEAFRFEGPMIAFAGPARLGVTVQELTDQLAGYFGAGDGVLVTTVGDDSAARTAGLRAGDVITRVDGEAVTNGAELRRRLTDAEGTATLTIVRDRKEQTITVTLPDGGTPKPTISR